MTSKVLSAPSRCAVVDRLDQHLYRALAQVAEERMSPAWHAADAGGCAAADSAVRGPLQHGAATQRRWIRDSGRYAGRSAAGDPRRARSQTGGGPPAAAAPPATSSMRFSVTMALPGETEAGSAGTQPCRGIAWWAHRDDADERGSHLSRSPQNHIGSKDPHALKIPARRAEYSLTDNARTPFQAEPGHPSRNGVVIVRSSSCQSTRVKYSYALTARDFPFFLCVSTERTATGR